MREIVGYAPVEPDGSVRMKVPANIAFQISILDINGRRVSPVHRSWLHVRPGEVLECNGCHVRTGHDADGPRTQGPVQFRVCRRDCTGGAFPGTVNTISPEAGDTMARARSRNGSSCIEPTTLVERCGPQAITPSANVVYDEIWNPAASPTDSFAYNYQQLTTAVPDQPELLPGLVADLPHHHSLRHHRRAPRVTSIRCGRCRDPRPESDRRYGHVTYPQTCTNCHNRINPADMTVQLPAASLELDDEDFERGCAAVESLPADCCLPRPELEACEWRRGSGGDSESSGCRRQSRSANDPADRRTDGRR